MILYQLQEKTKEAENYFSQKSLYELKNEADKLISIKKVALQINNHPEIYKDALKIDTLPLNKIQSLAKIRQEIKKSNPKLGFKIRYSISIQGEFDELSFFFKALFSGQIRNLVLIERDLVIEYESESSIDDEKALSTIKEKAKIDLTKVFEIYEKFLAEIREYNQNIEKFLRNILAQILAKKGNHASFEDKLNPFK